MKPNKEEDYLAVKKYLHYQDEKQQNTTVILIV